MPTRDDNIRIFIGSPGDVTAERMVVRAVVDELNEDKYFDNCRLHTVAWDSDAYANVASRTPQENIIAGLPRPSACEISVFIFWSRIGTTLRDGIPDDGRAPCGFEDIPLSGSVWELCDALGADREQQHYTLWFQCQRPYPREHDPLHQDEARQQQRHVEDLFNRARDEQGRFQYSVTPYEELEGMRKTLRKQLVGLVKALLHGAGGTDDDRPLPAAAPARVRTARRSTAYKPIGEDLCIAHIDRDENVGSARPQLHRGSERLVGLIAQGKAGDWHDALRIRLHYLDIDRPPATAGVRAIKWPNAGINTIDTLELQLWSPLAEELGDRVGISQHAKIDDTIVQLLEEYLPANGNRLILNYEIECGRWQRKDRALLERCHHRWRQLVQPLTSGTVVVLFSLVAGEPDRAESTSWVDAAIGLFGKAVAISPALIAEYFTGAVQLRRLGDIRLGHLDDWRDHLIKDFKLPAEQHEALYREALNTFGASASIPHETLRARLKANKNFLKILRPA